MSLSSGTGVSVVLPVYSETRTVREVASGLKELLGSAFAEIVIVLSPRSSAESRAVCESLAAEDARIRIHVQVRNPGLGRRRRRTGAL